MRAGVFRGVRQVPVEEVPDPVAGPGDVVLAVKACGICGSDLHAYAAGQLASAGQILGHEFAGEVVEVGAAVEGIAVGDRLTAPPVQPCGDCRRCREGSHHLCEFRATRSIGRGLPGAFAERLRIPGAVLGRNVLKLPDVLSFEEGALVEPLAVAAHAVGRAEVRPGQAAVVLGLGPIGLHAAQVLLARGVSPVIGADLSPLRRAVAGELGVTVIDDPADLPAAVRGHLGEREVDVVFEASGAPPLVQRAVELVRPRGLVLIVALYEQPVELDVTRMVSKEVSVRTSAHSGLDDFRVAIDLLATGQAKAHPLITHRRPLRSLGEAFEAMLDKDQAVKVLVTPDA